MNKLIDIKFSVPGSEPFDVTEAKTDLRIDFADDDAVLTRLIKSARKAIENYTSVSIITRTVKLTVDFCEEFELPYGPINAITEVKIRTGTATDGTAQYEALTGDEYTLDGESYKLFNSSRTGRHVITYTTLAESAEDLILAVKNELAFRYEFKGDEGQTLAAASRVERGTLPGLCEAALVLATPYRRMVWL